MNAMRLLQILITLIVATALLALHGCAENDSLPTAVTARPVSTMEVVGRIDQSQRTFPGTLRARDRADLSFEVSGIVSAVNVDIGDNFKRGDVLARIDDQLIKLDLERNKADLIEARATLAEAKLDYKRRAELGKTGAISEADLDSALTQLDRSRARVTSLIANVASAERRLKDTQILAPYDGEVAARHVEPPRTVQVGQAILSVVGLSAGMEAVFYLPERLRQHIQNGAPVSLNIKSTDEQLTGQVTQIGSSVNPVGLYPVTVAVNPEPKILLSSGMIVDIALRRRLSKADQNEGSATGTTIVIPITAIVATDEPQKSAVYIVDPATKKIALTPISISRLSEAGVVVASGLRTGDLVVTRGVSFLTDGQYVEPFGLNRQVARYNP